MQSAVERRLCCVRPEHFGADVRFVVLSEVQPPAGFEACWWAFRRREEVQGSPLLTASSLEAVAAIVALADLSDAAQLNRLRRLIATVDGCGSSAPLMLCVPVPTQEEDAPGQLDRAAPLLQLGLDDVVAGEPSGLALALAVRSSLTRLAAWTAGVQQELGARNAEAKKAAELKARIHEATWGYARHFAKAIPPVDTRLRLEDGKSLAGYKLGRKLGSGSYGTVMEVELLEATATARIRDGADVDVGCCRPAEVIKVIAKSPFMGLPELLRINSGIETLQTLGSAAWRHPGIIRLHGLLHTPTHLCLCMEHGGPENLNQRLRDRDRRAPDGRPLSTALLRSVVAQITGTIAHLHSGPRICHRDLKPENFTVQQQDGRSVLLKLVDFDFACTQKPGRQCRSKCGTVPFMAPEVVLSSAYDGFAADVWSTGVLLMEVLCVRGLVERAAGLQDTPNASSAELLKTAFGGAGLARRLLAEQAQPEAKPLLQALAPACESALDVDPEARCAATRLRDAILELPGASPSCAQPATRGGA